MITTCSEWVATLAQAVPMFLSLLFVIAGRHSISRLKGKQRLYSVALCTLGAVISVMTVIKIDVIITPSALIYWGKSKNGSYSKVPTSIWWRKDLNRRISSGEIVEKQVPDKIGVFVVQGVRHYKILCGTTNAEQEIGLCRDLKLPVEFEGRTQVMENLVLQAYGRHTNLADLAADPNLKHFTIYSIEPVKEGILGIFSAR